MHSTAPVGNSFLPRLFSFLPSFCRLPLFKLKQSRLNSVYPHFKPERGGEISALPFLLRSLVCHKLAVTPPKAHSSSSHTKTITYLLQQQSPMLARCCDTFQTLPTVPCIDPTERRLVRKPFSFSWAMRVDDSNYDAAARSLRCSCRSVDSRLLKQSGRW